MGKLKKKKKQFQWEIEVLHNKGTGLPTTERIAFWTEIVSLKVSLLRNMLKVSIRIDI